MKKHLFDHGSTDYVGSSANSSQPSGDRYVLIHPAPTHAITKVFRGYPLEDP